MYFAAEEIKTEANNLLKANYLHPINQDPKTVPSCRHVEDLQTRLINLNKKYLTSSHKWAVKFQQQKQRKVTQSPADTAKAQETRSKNKSTRERNEKMGAKLTQTFLKFKAKVDKHGILQHSYHSNK